MQCRNLHGGQSKAYKQTFMQYLHIAVIMGSIFVYLAVKINTWLKNHIRNNAKAFKLISIMLDYEWTGSAFAEIIYSKPLDICLIRVFYLNFALK